MSHRHTNINEQHLKKGINLQHALSVNCCDCLQVKWSHVVWSLLWQQSFIYICQLLIVDNCLLQSVNVKPEVVASIAGERVISVSSVMTLDPRRRKFHRPVTVSVPMTAVPTSHHVTSASDLRLLCNLPGDLADDVDFQNLRSMSVCVCEI